MAGRRTLFGFGYGRDHFGRVLQNDEGLLKLHGGLEVEKLRMLASTSNLQ